MTVTAASLEQSRERLQQQIAAAEAQLLQLRAELQRTEDELREVNVNGSKSQQDSVTNSCINSDDLTRSERQLPLTLEEYRRYGRQMILSQIGLPGQLSLRNARVLIVGAGGLGSPAALYLAAAGVGTLGLLDNDTVDTSNLHRQIIHSTPPTPTSPPYKVDSAIARLRALNPHVKYIPHRTSLTADTAEAVFRGYDVVLDCSDNPATRYLVSDAAVLLGMPLVSAAALATEGQLMLLNYPSAPAGAEGGPCYRCIFPRPPPAASVMKCAEGGVLGPVVGVMGVMQALEAIKVVIAMGRREKGESVEGYVPMLHLFSGYASGQPFRSVKLRGRRPDCAACSAKASVTLETLRNGGMDYALFCGSRVPLRLLDDTERVDPIELKKQLASPGRPILIDTRDETQFGIASLADDVVNVPINKLMSLPPSATPEELELLLPPELMDPTSTRSAVVLCRMGNDSQLAVKKLKELGLDRQGKRYIGDLRGGLWGWRRDVDAAFPEY